METGEPPYTGGDMEITGGSIAYGLGWYFILLLFIFTLCYASYMLNHTMIAAPPGPPHVDNYHFRRLSQGLLEDNLSTFPTFLYSEPVTTHKDNNETHSNTLYNGSCCSICLSDYKPAEVLRLLPECGHLFHVGCIDTWLKVHPTCPVCRNLLDICDP